jgi:uncharacterized protein YecE (DUF72 family)
MSGRLYVGTSGWNYPGWVAGLYAGVPRARWLAHYAARFNAVEVNASFYREVRADTWRRWASETPEGFRFAVKAHRYLTHMRRLDFDNASLARQRDATAALGGRLAAVLWQLPPSLARDDARLERFLAQLARWPQARHAVEFRHRSWFAPAVADALAARRVAICQSDAADWPLWDAASCDLVYLRLHGHRVTYRSRYGVAGLRAWAARAARWWREGRTVLAFFDNTDAGAAPGDAAALVAALARILRGPRP